MRVLALVAAGILVHTAVASAQFSAFYEGTTHMDGKTQPLTTRFSVDKGRVAAVMTGARSSRMIYVEKDGVLRVIDETSRSYFDLDRKSLEQFSGGAMAEAQKQMASAPPEQRAMMERMMQGMNTPAEKPVTYVWSKQTQTVKGYPCTRVDIMRGDEKRAEYWGTTSPDFTLSEDEHHAVIAMQECLNGLAIMARGGPGGGDQARAFQWDTATNGYPLISRCFEGADTTLDVHLVRFDHKPLDEDLFQVPAGYTKQEIGGAEMGKRHGRRQ